LKGQWGNQSKLARMSFWSNQRIFRSPLAPRTEMNQGSPIGCLLLVFVPCLLLVSTYLAWWELRFFVQGRSAVAVVDRVLEVMPRRHSLLGGSYLEVRYSFKDEVTEQIRTEHDELPLSWPHPVGTVPVQYIPGSPGGSRLEGHRHLVFTIFFAVSVIGSLVYGGLLLREARRAVRAEEAFELKRRRNRDC
jgi:hypothetical protein